MTQFVTDGELYERLRSILSGGWIPIPDEPGYGGTGAPGKLLENLLGISGQNYSIPDAGMSELKFHSRKALLTLFHLEPEPRGYMRELLREYGWPAKNGETGFRHTLRGRSRRGFYVINEGNRIIVKNDRDAGIEWPYWSHDRLLNAFAGKLRRLIVVKGTVRQGHVLYQSATLYWEPQLTQLADAIERGIVAIDFDARTQGEGGVRNHGTKIRISTDNLPLLYHHHQSLEP